MKRISTSKATFADIAQRIADITEFIIELSLAVDSSLSEPLSTLPRWVAFLIWLSASPFRIAVIPLEWCLYIILLIPIFIFAFFGGINDEYGFIYCLKSIVIITRLHIESVALWFTEGIMHKAKNPKKLKRPLK